MASLLSALLENRIETWPRAFSHFQNSLGASMGRLRGVFKRKTLISQIKWISVVNAMPARGNQGSRRSSLRRTIREADQSCTQHRAYFTNCARRDQASRRAASPTNLDKSFDAVRRIVGG